MMTQENESPATTAVSDAKAAAPATPKSATITLTAADGSVMAIVAERKGDGAKSYVLTTGADKKTSRGMTEEHATFDAAKAATEKLAKSATKLGWQRKVTRKGFVAKPDAFSSLPAAPKAKK
jgi:hypothetical protein